jgi:hypothetical protein
MVCGDGGDLFPAPDDLFPDHSHFSAWYATDFVLAVIIGLGLAGFGFYTSLAGEPLFRGARLDD